MPVRRDEEETISPLIKVADFQAQVRRGTRKHRELPEQDIPSHLPPRPLPLHPMQPCHLNACFLF